MTRSATFSPAVEPHIMLSRVWNALADRAELGAASSGSAQPSRG